MLPHHPKTHHNHQTNTITNVNRLVRRRCRSGQVGPECGRFDARWRAARRNISSANAFQVDHVLGFMHRTTRFGRKYSTYNKQNKHTICIFYNLQYQLRGEVSRTASCSVSVPKRIIEGRFDVCLPLL